MTDTLEDASIAAEAGIVENINVTPDGRVSFRYTEEFKSLAKRVREEGFTGEVSVRYNSAALLGADPEVNLAMALVSQFYQDKNLPIIPEKVVACTALILRNRRKR